MGVVKGAPMVFCVQTSIGAAQVMFRLRSGFVAPVEVRVALVLGLS